MNIAKKMILIDIRTPAHAELLIRLFQVDFFDSIEKKLIICPQNIIQNDNLLQLVSRGDFELHELETCMTLKDLIKIEFISLIFKIFLSQLKFRVSYMFPVNWGLQFIVIKFCLFNLNHQYYIEDGVGSYLNPNKIDKAKRSYLKNWIMRKILKQNRGFLGVDRSVILVGSSKRFYEYLGGKNIYIQVNTKSKLDINQPGYEHKNILFLSSQDVELGRTNLFQYEVMIDQLKRKIMDISGFELGRERVFVSLHHKENFALKNNILKQKFSNVSFIMPDVPAEKILNGTLIDLIISPFNSTLFFYMINADAFADTKIICYHSHAADLDAKKCLFSDVVNFRNKNHVQNNLVIEQISEWVCAD